MRSFNKPFLLSCSISLLFLALSTMIVSAEPDCYSEKGSDIEIRGICSSNTKFSFEVASKSYSVVFDYKAKKINSPAPFIMDIGGCNLENSQINSYYVSGDNKAVLNVKGATYFFPATVKVSDSGVTISDSDKQNIKICQSAQFENSKVGDDFTSSISFDPQNKAIPELLITIKGVKLPGSSLIAARVNVLKGVLIGVCVFVFLLAVSFSFGVAYYLNRRQKKKAGLVECGEAEGAEVDPKKPSKRIDSKKNVNVLMQLDKLVFLDEFSIRACIQKSPLTQQEMTEYEAMYEKEWLAWNEMAAAENPEKEGYNTQHKKLEKMRYVKSQMRHKLENDNKERSEKKRQEEKSSNQ